MVAKVPMAHAIGKKRKNLVLTPLAMGAMEAQMMAAAETMAGMAAVDPTF